MDNPKYRQLYQDNSLGSSLVYLGILCYVFHVMDMTEKFTHNVFRIWYVLISIVLVLITFLAAIRIKKYRTKWAIFAIVFGAINVILMISFTAVYMHYRNNIPVDPVTQVKVVRHIMKFFNIQVTNVASGSLFAAIKMMVLQLVFGVLMIASGIYSVIQSLKVAKLKQEVKEMK